MRIQIYNELKKLHPDLKGLKLLLAPNMNSWNGKDVWEACKNFDTTICLIESSH